MNATDKQIIISHKVFEDIPKLKSEIYKNFGIFIREINFINCAFFFTTSLEELQKIIFEILDSYLTDYKINKYDFIEATIIKEERDSNGNFIFPERAKVDLQLSNCYIGLQEQFKIRYNHLENLEE